MVQLQNADRLNTIIEFGTVEDVENENMVKVPTFVSKFKALCGLYSLSTNQLIELTGLNKNDVRIYLTHKRRSWNGITRARVNNELYKITNISPDPYNNPTAYDRITLQEAEKNG